VAEAMMVDPTAAYTEPVAESDELLCEATVPGTGAGGGTWTTSVVVPVDPATVVSPE
jgi:hypothetical protein